MITAKEVHDIMNQNLSQNEKEVQSVAIKILDKIVRKILDEANSGRSFINIYDNWVFGYWSDGCDYDVILH